MCACLQAVQGDLFDVAGAAADPAMDMWALGAIAFEIFTAQGLFSRKSYTDNDVINMLLGFDRLPSESQPAFWRQIRDTAAQRLVQNLLRRVPEQRSTINEVRGLSCICWYNKNSDTQSLTPRIRTRDAPTLMLKNGRPACQVFHCSLFWVAFQ